MGILDREFRYTPAASTDIRRLFARIRKRVKEEAAKREAEEAAAKAEAESIELEAQRKVRRIAK